MERIEIVELPDFEYTPKGLEELRTTLKAGKAVRNPFAKFYNGKVEVVVLKDSAVDYRQVKAVIADEQGVEVGV
jgi:hypothetical protein